MTLIVGNDMSGTLPSFSPPRYDSIESPVILYGAEPRPLYPPTPEESGCVCGVLLLISWRARISNEEVRRRNDQPPLTHVTRTTRLKFFGHIARADPCMDHSRALTACVAPFPREWNRRSG